MKDGGPSWPKNKAFKFAKYCMPKDRFDQNFYFCMEANDDIAQHLPD